MVLTGEVASNCQPAAGQRQTDGLPVATKRLQDGHPVCLLTECVCLSVSRFYQGNADVFKGNCGIF